MAHDKATPLRAWREHLGMTQLEVAKAIGSEPSVVARYEIEQTLPRAAREQLAAALGILPAQLDL